MPATEIGTEFPCRWAAAVVDPLPEQRNGSLQTLERMTRQKLTMADPRDWQKLDTTQGHSLFAGFPTAAAWPVTVGWASELILATVGVIAPGSLDCSVAIP